MIYSHSIKLADALTSAPVRFKTLDGRDISLNLDQVLTPQSVHCMVGEGMPVKKEPPADPSDELAKPDPNEMTNHLKPLSAL